MPRKKDTTQPQEKQLDFLAQLDKLTGEAEELELAELDAVVLWAVTVLLAEERSSITLGTTQDGASWVLQLWDGKFPRKWYFRETGRLNRHLAAIIRSVKGNDVAPDLEDRLRHYGW